MSSADRYAALVASKRPLYNDKALPDTCQVKGKSDTPVTDSRGNKYYPEITKSTVRCQLKTGGLRPDERAVADQVQAVAPYAIDLPYGTDVDASDFLVVNGSRRFSIVGVLTAGGFGINTTAIVEERT